MKLNKMSLVAGILIITMLLTGCHTTPSTTIIDNTPVDTKPQENETIKIEDLPHITLHEEAINETLELEGVTLTINGIVSKPDTTEGLYTYYSEFRDFVEYLPKMSYLFGEYEDQMYLDGQYYYRVDVPEIEYWAYLFAMDSYVSYLRATVPVSEEEVAVNLTNEEAISMANDILDDIGVTEVELHTCDYEEEILQITPDGELSGALGDRLNVDYYQNLQGVPVMSTLYGKDVKTRVVFCSRGIREVRITILDYVPYYRIEECISFEEAMEIFKETVAKNEDFDGLNMDRVLFEYTVKKEYIDGKFVEVAVPAWHFYKEMPYWSRNTQEEVVVNAITGVATLY